MVDVPSLPEAIRATLPPLAVAYLAALETAVAALATENRLLAEQVAVLQAQLGQNSSNSSRPPSSDPPRGAPASKPMHGQRQAGGQPGHRGHVRVLLPETEVTTVQHYLPPACGQCGRSLAAVAAAADPPDQRHQVVDLAPVTVTITEHRLAARTCPHCGHCTRAAWPVGVPQGLVGPHLAATVALLTGRYRLAKREAVAALTDLYGVRLSVGALSAIEAQVSAALAPAVAEARAAVPTAPVVNMDETGWRQGRQRAWLWTAVTRLVTVFHIDPSRGSAVVRQLLGPEWDGIVGSDRFSAYRWLGAAGRQVCWAHLRRDFQKLVDWGPGPRPVGERLIACHDQIFELWHRHRAGELDRGELAGAISRIAAEMHAVLTIGATSHAVAQPLCRELLAVWPALWTFVLTEGVEPTNNRAEQALRPAVLWRKGSFGTHSAAGSRFVERMLTVTATRRQHHRSVADFLVATLTAAHTGQPHPSLLPATP